MTKLQQHQAKAKAFIDGVFKREHKSRTELIKDLNEQIETWRERHRALSRTNLFDLSNQEYDRMNYIDALIDYGTAILIDSIKFSHGGPTRGMFISRQFNWTPLCDEDKIKELTRDFRLKELGV